MKKFYPAHKDSIRKASDSVKKSQNSHKGFVSRDKAKKSKTERKIYDDKY